MFKALGMATGPEHAPESHAADCNALERVAQQNRLACLVAERAATAGAKLELSFEFTQHRSFPVASLKSKK
jgi:hypothetical protein